jgi:sialate O-acetylesterase
MGNMRTYVHSLKLTCSVIASIMLTSLMGSIVFASPLQGQNSISNALSLPNIFADHMVIQRHKPIVLWGKAKPDTQITVTLIVAANKKEVATGIANTSGQWQLSLPAQKAGGPFRLEVSSESDKLAFQDVLIGDVWLASGQSNMEWKLGWKVDNWESEVKQSNNPQIRFFEVDKTYSARPQTNIPSKGWKLASPLTSAEFSAVAWYFAKNYHQQKNIPVAIIDSTWGGTPAEAWTSLPSLQHINGYQQEANEMLEKADQWKQKFIDNGKLEAHKWQLLDDQSAYQDGKLLSTEFNDQNWRTIILPIPSDKPLQDIVWLRKRIEVKNKPQQATLNIGEINQIGKVFINGTLIYQKRWQDVTQLITLPENLLKVGENIIVIRAVNSWDNRVFVGKDEQLSLDYNGQKHDLSGEWKFSNNVEEKLPNVKNYYWKTGVLFNSMINPLTQFPISGVIWYQGESNVDKAGLYTDLFKGLIRDWRQQWKDPQLPFVFVQLASYLQTKDTPEESAWAELREAQTNALELANTAMAVTIDIGEANDIHPRNKHDVGYRLWLAANHLVFADNQTYSGPQMQQVKVHNNGDKTGVMVMFEHTQSGLYSPAATILGFELAGSSGKFVNAHAEIIGNQVFVYAPNIKKPTRLRYAWANNSKANLYNKEKLPAIPFQATVTLP